jgi:ABC-2 type transport system ATP-binding protein
MMDAVVSTQQLGKSIGTKTLLRDITVSVAPGNIVGILGKNGAGKTTLLDILLGFSPATQGTASLFGTDSFALTADTKRRIGFVPQQDDLIDSLTGAQHVSLSASLHRHWDSELIARLGNEWDIPLEHPVQALSGGQRQKISTLLALGHIPDLLVLDEPASSLDPIARRQFLQQLLDIAQAPSRTVLFSTHIVADLERVANKVWIIREGAIAWQGDLDTLKESVVRLRLHGHRPLPPSLAIDGVLSQRVDGVRANIVVGDWSESRHHELARHLNADVTVENLSLEDIFLELHR